MIDEPTFPGCRIACRPIAVFTMVDEKGPDDHLVCVPCNDPGWNTLEDVDDLPRQLRAEISHFFTVYKDLDPDRHSEVQGWGDRDAALKTIEKGRKAFIEGS